MGCEHDRLGCDALPDRQKRSADDGRRPELCRAQNHQRIGSGGDIRLLPAEHHFYIAKEFVRDNIDIDILEELLSLGGLGLQYCIKSKAAYANLREKSDELLVVPYAEFNDRYNQRDVSARNNMRELVDSDANKVTKVFSTLFER